MLIPHSTLSRSEVCLLSKLFSRLIGDLPCLASRFSCQEDSWIFGISCQDLGNYYWQGSQYFARFFKIVEKNPRKLLDFWARKCKRSLLGLIPVRSSSSRLSLQDEDHSGSRFHSFPGFLCLNSGMFAELVRSELGIVGSEKIHLVVIRRPKSDFPSY